MHVCLHTHAHSRPWILIRDQLHLLHSPTQLLPFSCVQQRTEACHAWAHTHTHVDPSLPILFITTQPASNTTNGGEGWRVPPAVALVSVTPRGQSTCSWSSHCSLFLSAKAYLEVGWRLIWYQSSWTNKTRVNPDRERERTGGPKDLGNSQRKWGRGSVKVNERVKVLGRVGGEQETQRGKGSDGRRWRGFGFGEFL